MRILKKLSAMALTLLLAVSSVCAIPVYAQDYSNNGATLTASWDAKSKKLSLNESGVLFEENNIVPGDRINSQVVVKNDTGTDVTVSLIRVENTNNTKPDLYQYMTTSITQGNQSLYAGKMVNGTTGPVTKEISLAKGETKTVYITVEMPNTVGNEAQGGTMDTNWVWQVYMQNEPVTDTGNNNGNNSKQPGPTQPPQVAIVTTPSSANKSIQSGVDDVFHSESTNYVLLGLTLAFAIVALLFVKSNYDEKKANSVKTIDGECKAVEDDKDEDK